MKISVENFKSIGKLEDLELKPLTIFSGNNSAGKSSFLQLLLILKQTLDIASSRKQLFTQGDFFSAMRQVDLIKDKDATKELNLRFSISKPEFASYGERVQKSLFDGFPEYSCLLEVVFGFYSNSLQLKRLNLEYTTEINTQFLRFEKGNTVEETKIESNNTSNFLTSESNYDDSENVIREIKKVNYSAFLPISYDESVTIVRENEKGETDHFTTNSITRLNINSIRSFLEAFAEDLLYIGPLRVEPQDAYSGHPEKNWVGVKGEYTAQVLESMGSNLIVCNFPSFEDGSIKFHTKESTLLEATNYWICEVFQFAEQISVQKLGESYAVLLRRDGVETTLKHVGFGISQILPIVVQGLLMNIGATLILEQPEIHLHPKIQSLLFDFLYAQVVLGRNFIVETHSDHFITRMRRRVAEDKSSQLQEQINLSFVEKEDKKLLFKRIRFDSLGVYEFFPEDFIENSEQELTALLDAQMSKRKANRK